MELVDTALKYNLSPGQTVSLIICLSKMGGSNYIGRAGLGSHSTFMSRIHESMGSGKDNSEFMTVGDSVMALRSLLYLGADPSLPVVDHLQNRVLSAVNLLNKSALVNLAVMHAQYRETTNISAHLQAKLESRLKLALQANEPLDVEDILLLMNKIPYQGGGVVQTDWQKLLERQAGMAIRMMDAFQCVRLVVILGSLGSRNVSLLKHASHQLVGVTREESLSMKHIQSLLGVCNSLSFSDPILLEKLCGDLKAHLSQPHVLAEMKVQTVRQFLLHFGVIQWRDTQVLDLLCGYLEERLEELKSTDLVSPVLTLAKCNYEALPEKDFLPRVRDKFQYDVFIGDWKDSEEPAKETQLRRRNQIWLDVVWSLGILGHITPSLARSVLDKSQESLVQMLLHPSCNKMLVNRQRLKNVEACLRLDLGPEAAREVETWESPAFLKSRLAYFGKPPQIEITEGKTPYRPSDLLCAAVHHTAPRESHSKMQIWNEYGYFIDCQIVFGKDGRPVAVQNWDKPVEPGTHRKEVIVLSWDYGDFVRGAGDKETALTGANAMRLRHLQKMGYTVLHVPISELKQVWKFADKVQHMKNKLEFAISDDN